MVYRGKPSAGCENCRKAKKKCSLGSPCLRCIKLKKACGGYRDVSQLQIQDESAAVILKANKQGPRASGSSKSPVAAPVVRATSLHGKSTPETPGSSTATSEISLPPSSAADSLSHKRSRSTLVDLDATEAVEINAPGGTFLTFTMKPTPEDLGSNYFFSNFTSDNGHWSVLRNYEKRAELNPLLGFAMKACGLAALDNVHGVQMGRSYSRMLYAQALTLLNKALRDPRQCKSDESLIAVAMLGYFENITCDSKESIASWKAHIQGATQLLKLRGKAQFNSAFGRMLFRENRAQFLIRCIWDDLEPPAFLIDWEDDLRRLSDELQWIGPADELTMLTFEFAQLRYELRVRKVSYNDAIATASDIEMRMSQWAVELMKTNPFWQYRQVEVPDSPEVWNGQCHIYNGHPTASVWGTYRNVRIMVTRTQEFLIRRLALSPEQKERQLSYLKSVRRQMTDEICMGIPSQLGHGPTNNSKHILITAYSSIWPLFFAGTCALERIGPGLWSTALQDMTPSQEASTSAALAQAMWIIGRMEHISRIVGLKWAEGVAATLRGDFAMHEELLPEGGPPHGAHVPMFWLERMAEMRRNREPGWLKKVQEGGPGPRVTMEENAPLSTGLMAGAYPKGLWKGRVQVDEKTKKYRNNSMNISSIINP